MSTYILKIEHNAPDLDVPNALRAAVGWMSDHIEPTGQYDLVIEVSNADGDVITRHEYEADLDDDDECLGHESLDGAHMGETVYCDGSCRG